MTTVEWADGDGRGFKEFFHALVNATSCAKDDEVLWLLQLAPCIKFRLDIYNKIAAAINGFGEWNGREIMKI